jgi:uncharacterized protein with PIN domain
MATATLRFYAELNDFLAPERRQRDWRVAFEPPVPLRHLIETCGVPHTEVELILRDGRSVGLEEPVTPGDRFAVYPMFEAFDISPLVRLRPTPLREPKFIADAHLGKLARRLRMLGFDTVWCNDMGDAALAGIASTEHRILLTSDRALLMRRAVSHGCHVPPGSTSDQLAALVRRLQLCGSIRPFTRCTMCNGRLTPLTRKEAALLVPPGVTSRYREFWRCAGCDRIYWKGSHWESMRRRIASICTDAFSDVGAVRVDSAP